MADIAFYHLEHSALTQALPKLLEKALAAGHRAIVRAPDTARMEALDAALWTYDPASFLPHGTMDEGECEAQPIYLTTCDEAPNGARILVLVDGIMPSVFNVFDRYLYIFEGQDPAALELARGHWRQLKDGGHALTYWQQTERGGWEKRVG